jgi:hypothetical protein
MSKCKNCERELQKGEVEYCPACTSSKSHKIKKIFEVVAPLLTAVGVLVIKRKFFSKE